VIEKNNLGSVVVKVVVVVVVVVVFGDVEVLVHPSKRFLPVLR
jgi:hypothetical protein